MPHARQELIDAIKSRALKFGDFTLKSGAKSHFYLDLRVLTISTYLPLIVDGIKATIEEMTADWPYKTVGGYQHYDAIGGPSIGADPIVGAFLYSHRQFDRSSPSFLKPLRGFLVRKQEKGHGLDGLVIGSIEPDDRCIMIEDVTTTASSVITAINAVHAFGGNVVGVVSVVDRSGGAAADNLASHKIPFRSVLTLEDLGITTDASPNS